MLFTFPYFISFHAIVLVLMFFSILSVYNECVTWSSFGWLLAWPENRIKRRWKYPYKLRVSPSLLYFGNLKMSSARTIRLGFGRQLWCGIKMSALCEVYRLRIQLRLNCLLLLFFKSHRKQRDIVLKHVIPNETWHFLEWNELLRLREAPPKWEVQLTWDWAISSDWETINYCTHNCLNDKLILSRHCHSFGQCYRAVSLLWQYLYHPSILSGWLSCVNYIFMVPCLQTNSCSLLVSYGWLGLF